MKTESTTFGGATLMVGSDFPERLHEVAQLDAAGCSCSTRAYAADSMLSNFDLSINDTSGSYRETFRALTCDKTQFGARGLHVACTFESRDMEHAVRC